MPIDAHGAARRACSGGLKSTVAAQALVTLLDEAGRVEAFEPIQLADEGLLETLRHVLRIAVRAAQGLLDHLVDQAKLQQTRGGDAEGFGRILGALGGFPQDRGAALR